MLVASPSFADEIDADMTLSSTGLFVEVPEQKIEVDINQDSKLIKILSTSEWECVYVGSEEELKEN